MHALFHYVDVYHFSNSTLPNHMTHKKCFDYLEYATFSDLQEIVKCVLIFHVLIKLI